MAVEAIWNDTVIAHSDETVLVEGNHYFPKADVDTSMLEKSEGGFMLQNVVTEYVTDHLINQVCTEIEQGIEQGKGQGVLLSLEALIERKLGIPVSETIHSRLLELSVTQLTELLMAVGEAGSPATVRNALQAALGLPAEKLTRQ